MMDTNAEANPELTVEDDQRINWADDEHDPPSMHQKRQYSDDQFQTDQFQITYASVTKPPQVTQSNEVSHLIPSHADIYRRALILQRVSYNTSTEDITNALRDSSLAHGCAQEGTCGGGLFSFDFNC